MHVPTTFGRLVLGATLCGARACAPDPLSSTISTSAGETDTTSAATQISTTTVSSITESFTTEVTEPLATLIATSETSSIIETATEASTSIVEFISTTAEPTLSTTAEPTTSTTVEPPLQTVEIVRNGGFESSGIDPWQGEGGAYAALDTTSQLDGNQCYSMSGPYSSSDFGLCQSVGLDQGYEYTFSAWIKQTCRVQGDNIPDQDCSNDSNLVELSVAQSYTSGQVAVLNDNQYHEFTGTFQYVNPSIEETDLCIRFTASEGTSYEFYVDSVSFTRGKSVPIPHDE